VGDAIPAQDAAERVIGRSTEREALELFLDESLSGGGAVTLEGEPGVGKTHLLREAELLASVRGATVLRASGVQYEAELSFGVLHQLLRPIGQRFNDLSTPAASALRAALGEWTAPATQPLEVFSALLSLLELVSRDAPLLIAIDDLQWVDPSTSAAIAFVARRIRGSPIAIIGVLRRGEPSAFPADEIPAIEVRPLTASASRQLLAAHFPGLPSSAGSSLVELAAGYPLALLEWGAALNQREGPTLDPRIELLSLPHRVEAMFASRIGRVPPTSRRALLLLALDGRSSLRDLVSIGLTIDELAPAEALGLITIEPVSGSIDFRHPLMRSAVVTSASTTERRRVHLSIAERLADDMERRASHLARAALGPDESVAQLLESVAQRSFRRGDTLGAAANLIRAADLSPSEEDRARRLAEAAYFGADITGERANASLLLKEARATSTGRGSLYAVAARAQLSVNEDGDYLASLKAIDTAVNSGRHGWRADDRELTDTLRTWLVLCSYAGDPASWDGYFAALNRLVPSIPPVLQTESAAFADPIHSGPDTHANLIAFAGDRELCADPATLGTLSTAAMYMDALEPYRPHNERFVHEGRRGGARLPYARALSHLAVNDLVHGRWDDALALSAEGKAVCDEHFAAEGSWFFAYIQAFVAAGRGDTASARESIIEIEQLCAARGSSGAGRFRYQPASLAAIADEDWEEAYQVASRLSAPGQFAPYVPVAMWVAFDLVEAALRTGRSGEALAHADAMTTTGLANVSGRMALITAGARALVVSDDIESGELFQRTIDAPDAAEWPFELARVQLAYGERLRRSGHPTAAREVLADALARFEYLEARPWVSRTIEELRAAGDPQFRSGSYVPRSSIPLTRQEAAVAELAARGLSNKEIARRLFLSPRTVSGHLYNAFPKLGVTTRAGLRDALDNRDVQAVDFL
jgi:DNA-binding CsgD family transcriptional regulator